MSGETMKRNASPRACPSCGAAPGDTCRTRNGGPAYVCHMERIACPKCTAARVDLVCWHCGWKHGAPPPPEKPESADLASLRSRLAAAEGARDARDELLRAISWHAGWKRAVESRYHPWCNRPRPRATRAADRYARALAAVREADGKETT